MGDFKDGHETNCVVAILEAIHDESVRRIWDQEYTSEQRSAALHRLAAHQVILRQLGFALVLSSHARLGMLRGYSRGARRGLCCLPWDMRGARARATAALSLSRDAGKPAFFLFTCEGDSGSDTRRPSPIIKWHSHAMFACGSPGSLDESPPHTVAFMPETLARH